MEAHAFCRSHKCGGELRVDSLSRRRVRKSLKAILESSLDFPKEKLSRDGGAAPSTIGTAGNLLPYGRTVVAIAIVNTVPTFMLD